MPFYSFWLIWFLLSDDIRIALFTLKVSLSLGVKSASLAHEYIKSYEPSCMTSCEVETSPSVAVEHSKWKTYELRTRGLQRLFVLTPEELGSRSAELIRILLLQSHTQRASIVASPPTGGSSNQNEIVCTFYKQNFLF